jgi:hypothetical protein
METISERKVEANRRNPQQSTGPKTTAGKRAVRSNALRHGLLAKAVIIPKDPAQESRREFGELLRRLRRGLRPQGVLEELQVERLAVAYWRKRRALGCEVGEIQDGVNALEAPDDPPTDVDDTTPLTASDRQALRESSTGLDFLLGLLREVRREVQGTGVLREETAERLVHWFRNVPDGFARRCRELSANVTGAMFEESVETEDPEEPEVERAAGAEGCARALLRLINQEIKALKAEKARLATVPEEEFTLSGDDPSVRRANVLRPKVMDRLRRYERALDRDFDRALAELERLQRRRRRAAERSSSRGPEGQATPLGSEELPEP